MSAAGFELEGPHVVLEPLGARHVDGLAAAAALDRDRFRWTEVPDGRAAAEEYVRGASAAAERGQRLPFAVRSVATGEIVGSTSFLELQRWSPKSADDAPDSVEVGATWYSSSCQGTVVNPACKLLLLAHAFDEWQVHRVQLKTDARNARSRAAIAKVGARLEGVLRAYQPGLGSAGSDVVARDTAMYSIIRAEWPAVRDGLVERLSRYA